MEGRAVNGSSKVRFWGERAVDEGRVRPVGMARSV